MKINSETKLFCSFSKNPGNNGAIFFNDKFEQNNINAIYKPFFSDDIKKSVAAARYLRISGFAVSMPFKIEVLNYVDHIDETTKLIGSCNTVLNFNGEMQAYNTDWLAIRDLFFEKKITSPVMIAGNGGFSMAVQFALKDLNIPYKVITRQNWDNLENTKELIFNATPIEIENKYNQIDARPSEPDGKIIARLQAEHQFKLYKRNI
jgi:shikimate dehydrogenase